MYKSRLIYLAILIAAFVFSQALYESISYMTLIIVLILPVFSVLMSVLSYPLVSVNATTSKTELCRFDKFLMCVTVNNKSPLISPSLKITCSVPDIEGKTTEQVVFVLNSSFARKGSFDYSCSFAYRGINEITVDNVEYYDFLKLIKIKKKIAKSAVVTVKPRRIELKLPVSSYQQNQENSNMVGTANVLSGGDMIGVREYSLGDNLKNVHWKLSAKSEELIMKSFAENIYDKAFVIADMSAYYSDEYTSKAMTDCVVEATLSAIRSYVESSVRFSLLINISKNESIRYPISTPNDLFAAESVLSLTPMINNTSVLDTLRNIDFNSLSGCEVCIISSFASEEVLKNIKKIFIDKKCRLNIINISKTESKEKDGVIVYTKQFIENQGRSK